tara:strand:+ start:1057 stop:1536 length:480 start_codon:yes stop_codon:yes gene_type:complete
MAYFSGQNGNMRIANPIGSQYEAVTAVKDWSINFQMATLDTSTLGDRDNTILPGLRSFDGSCTVLYYSTPGRSNFEELGGATVKSTNQPLTNTSGPNFGALADAAIPVQLQLKVINGNDVKTCGVSVYITGFQMTCSTGEVFSASVSFTGTGAPHEFNF